MRTGIALFTSLTFYALRTGRAGGKDEIQRYAGVGLICQNARCITGSYRSNGYGGRSTGCALRTGIALFTSLTFYALRTGRAGGKDEIQRYAGVGLICQNARCITGSYRSNGYGGCSAGCALRTGITLFTSLTLCALWTGRAGGEDEIQRYAGIGLICQNARCITGSYRSNGYGGCSTGCALRTGITLFAL